MDISGLQFPVSADAPVFNYGGGINGNPKKASLAYGDCLLNGGNSVDCGASAWKAGANMSTQNDPWNDGTVIGRITSNGDYEANPNNSENQKYGQVGKGGWGSGVETILGISLTRISTAIIGFILIAGAVFMLKGPAVISNVAGGIVSE